MILKDEVVLHYSVIVKDKFILQKSVPNQPSNKIRTYWTIELPDGNVTDAN